MFCPHRRCDNYVFQKTKQMRAVIEKFVCQLIFKYYILITKAEYL